MRRCDLCLDHHCGRCPHLSACDAESSGSRPFVSLDYPSTAIALAGLLVYASIGLGLLLGALIFGGVS